MLKKHTIGTSLVAQQLGLQASTAEGKGSIPGGGTKIPHAINKNKNKKHNSMYCYKYTYTLCRVMV